MDQPRITRIARMKILHTVEFYFPSRGGAQEVVRRISEELVKRGHEVTVATTKLAERQARSLHGVRIEEFAEPDLSFRSRHNIPREQPLLLTVGSHTGAKGHSLTMEAFRRAKIGPATFVIIGNTVGSPGCLPRCYVQAKLVELTTFAKKQVMLLNPPRKDVVSAYHSADLFVFGSSIECSPIVLFAAAPSQTRFLSSNCGNAAEIAEWTGGGRVLPTAQMLNQVQVLPPATATSMANEIEELLSDKAALESMGEAGFQAWKSRFTWENIAAQYEQVYKVW